MFECVYKWRTSNGYKWICLSQDEDVIPGLYAAGETAGLYYGKYPGGTSVLRGLVFGRRAGEHAVSYVSDAEKLGV